MSTEDNKALARRAAEEMWNQGNVDVVDDLVDPQAIGHDQGEGMRPEHLKQAVREFRQAFPDIHFTVDSQVAEGDDVVSFSTMRGTHRGELRGIHPTGRTVTVKGVSHIRIRDGKVVEEWVQFDQLGMLKQLGTIPDEHDMSPNVTAR